MFLLLLNFAFAAGCTDKIYAIPPSAGQSITFYYNAKLPGALEVEEAALVDCKPDYRILKLQGGKYVLDMAKKALADAADAADLARENSKMALIAKAKSGSLTATESSELLKLLAEKL